MSYRTEELSVYSVAVRTAGFNFTNRDLEKLVAAITAVKEAGDSVTLKEILGKYQEIDDYYDAEEAKDEDHGGHD